MTKRFACSVYSGKKKEKKMFATSASQPVSVAVRLYIEHHISAVYHTMVSMKDHITDAEITFQISKSPIIIL